MGATVDRHLDVLGTAIVAPLTTFGLALLHDRAKPADRVEATARSTGLVPEGLIGR